MDKLHKSEGELQSTARQLIEQYRNELLKSQNKEEVLANFNKNNTILLLNNREASKTFKNRTMFPPIVGDTNYEALVESLPVGEVSDVFTLRSKIDGENKPYAYVVFFITEKKGTGEPVDMLANKYVSSSNLE
jgi:hypothetical protein